MTPYKYPCTVCGRQFLVTTKVKHDGVRARERGYCSLERSKEYCRRVSSATMARTNRKHASTRMKTNNPMNRVETRERYL